MKVIPVGTNSKTSENQNINHAKFVCSRYESIKMRVDTTKSWFAIDSSDKIVPSCFPPQNKFSYCDGICLSNP